MQILQGTSDPNASGRSTDARSVAPSDAPAFDLQRYCGNEDEIRWYLQHPWREPGVICASNGHLCIEIPDDGRELKDTGGKPPSIAKLFAKSTLTDFVPMPALPSIKEAGACPRCNGAGKHFVVPCEDCGGAGEFDYGRYTYTCRSCEGEGAIGNEDKPTACLACEGFGEPGGGRTAHRFVIGKAGFQTRYLRAFASLPNVQIAVGEENEMAIIRFDGGRGAVMPMKPRD